MKSTYAPLVLIAVVLAMAIYGATRDREPALATEDGQGMAGTGTSEVQVPVRTYATPMPPEPGMARTSGDIAAEQPDKTAPAQTQTPGGSPISAGQQTDTGAPEQAAPAGGAGAGTGSAADGKRAAAETPRAATEETPADAGAIEQAWDAVKEGVEEGVEEVQEVTKQGLEATKKGLEKAGAATVDLFSGDEQAPKGQ